MVPLDLEVDVVVFRKAHFLIIAGAIAVGRDSVTLVSDVDVAV